MYPVVMLAAGVILLGIFFWKVPLDLSLKQRVQVIIISSLLVGLTLLLAALYTWMIAALAFWGLLLLFIVIVGKKFEVDEWEDEHKEEMGELSEKEEPVFSIDIDHEKELSEIESAMEESTNDLDEKEDVEEDVYDFFEHRPKSLLTEEETDSTDEAEDLGIRRLGLTSSMKESDESDLPIRVAPEVDWMNVESLLHRDETTEVNLSNSDQKDAKDELVSARQRLFEELENDD